MNLLMTLLLGFLFIVITVLLARRKHRNPWLWGVNGFFGVVLALIALAFFGDLEKMPPEEAQKSRVREKVASAVLIILGLLAQWRRMR